MKNLVVCCLALLLFATGAVHASGPPPPAGPDPEAGIDLSGAAQGRSTDPLEFSEPRSGVDVSGNVVAPPQEAISTLYTRQVTSAAQHEVETAITALTINGVDHTVGAYMINTDSTGYPNEGTTWEIRTRKSTNLTSWTQRIPTKPAGATRTVDPVLSANVYTTGVSPLTVYLGGLGTASGSDTRTVAVWRSTDGGNSWSSPVTVDQSTTNDFRLDKPVITVSWYASTRGHVFVAYVLTRNSFSQRNQNKLFVARSTDGGVTFGTPVQVVQNYVHVPQILVSSHTGNVYLVYIDHTLNKLRMATSTNQGATWTFEDVTAPTGKFLDVWSDPFISGGSVCDVQAITVPHARFNWVRGSIGIVWHERETTSTSSNTDVWFIAKTASGWTNKKRVNPTQTRDQWMPALDFDESGNYVVVYYDRSADATNVKYKEAWSQIDPLYPTPSLLASGLVTGAFASDPTVFNLSFCFKGEYQDIWYWPYSDATGGRFNSFWSGTTSSTVFDNVYLSGLQ